MELHSKPRDPRAGPFVELGMTNLLDTKTAAECLRMAPGTLENWRTQGVGPKFIKTAGKRGRVLYDPADIEAWKEANRYQSTSEAEAA